MTKTMKEAFLFHHRLTEEEKTEMLKSCIFVFDTNSLLNIYRYNNEARQALLLVMEELKERIWIPFYVVKEFYSRRIDVILEQKNKYNELTDAIEASLKALMDGKFSKSKFLKIEEAKKILLPGIESAKKLVQEQMLSHPELISDDPYLEKLVEIIGDSIGNEPDENALKNRYTQAEERLKNDQPPGFCDKNKSFPAKFGDVLIWFEMLHFSEEKKKPIIFISDDNKKDWWQIIEGQRIGPRPELREEMLKKAGVDFNLYNPSFLLFVAKQQLNIKVSDKSIEEAEYVSKELDLDSLKTFQKGFYIQDDISDTLKEEAESCIPTNSHINFLFRKLLPLKSQKSRNGFLNKSNFGLLSKEAVIDWFNANYKDSQVSKSPSGNFPDLYIKLGNETTALEIKALQNISHESVISKFADICKNGLELIRQGECDHFKLIFVTRTKDSAAEVKKMFSALDSSEDVLIPIIGYLDESYQFTILR